MILYSILLIQSYFHHFGNIIGLNHMDAYYVSENGWDESPDVINGASNFFNEVLEDKGTHSRAILGLSNLPRNFCAGIVSTFTLNNRIK